MTRAEKMSPKRVAIRTLALCVGMLTVLPVAQGANAAPPSMQAQAGAIRIIDAIFPREASGKNHEMRADQRLENMQRVIVQYRGANRRAEERRILRALFGLPYRIAHRFEVTPAIVLDVDDRGLKKLRRLCEHCKKPGRLSPETLAADPRYEAVGFTAESRIFEAVGCARCSGSGFRGRIAVFEILTMSDRIVNLASAGADNARIEAAALEEGMTTMADDAVQKALQGLTAPAEVIRVTGFR